MASTIKVDKIEGSTGSTITVPTGQTLTVTDGIPVASGGTGLASFSAGDILYATGSTTLAKLAKGTAEQVLAMNTGATAPDWGSVDLTVLPTITVAKGGTNLTSFTAGDILYATGATTLAKLAKGAASEVIAMNSGATAPEWVTAGAGKTLQCLRADASAATQGNATTSGYGGTTIGDVGTAHISISITPSSTTSIIYAAVSGPAGGGDNGGWLHGIWFGATPGCIVVHNGYAHDAGGAVASASLIPGSTSTISVQWRSVGQWSGNTYTLGSLRGDSTSTNVPSNCKGTMTVWEIEP